MNNNVTGHLTIAANTHIMAPTTIIGTASASNRGESYKTVLTSGTHSLLADEPAQIGGTDLGPAPGDYLCMALSSCKAITMRMYAQRKGWQVEEINVTADFIKGENMETGRNTFLCKVKLVGTLDEEQVKRMLHIARVCPVDKLLTRQNDVVTSLY